MADKGSRFSLDRSARALQETVTRSGPAASASYTLVGAVILLGGIGYWVDRRFGTAPWGVMIGLGLGMIVGFYELIKVAWRR